MHSFSTGLALIAVTAHASQWGASWAPKFEVPQWGESHRRPEKPETPQWQQSQQWGESHRQPEHSHGYYAPQHTQSSWSKPEEHTHDPWSTTQNHHNYWKAPAPAKPEGWYSPTMQFTAPRITYVPLQAQSRPIYTSCLFSKGVIDFAQLPGHAISVRVGFANLAAHETPTVIINTYGTCISPGPEFNPLHETDKYGNSNPYQDPARGTIVLPAANDTGSIDQIVLDKPLLQNLAGMDSLCGRSLTLQRDGEADECCEIVQSMVPPVPNQAKPQPQPMAPASTHQPVYTKHGKSHNGFTRSYYEPHYPRW